MGRMDGDVLRMAGQQAAGRHLEVCQVAPVAAGIDSSEEGSSRASSYTHDPLLLPGRLADTAEQQHHHHLLRHCLNAEQRQQALEHFGSCDVREAAKEIGRMGQRELQGKFKLVYGTATHSNNNNWLRRKLYEAIGAAPLKGSKVGPPKAAQSKPRSSKPAGAKSPRASPPPVPRLTLRCPPPSAAEYARPVLAGAHRPAGHRPSSPHAHFSRGAPRACFAPRTPATSPLALQPAAVHKAPRRLQQQPLQPLPRPQQPAAAPLQQHQQPRQLQQQPLQQQQRQQQEVAAAAQLCASQVLPLAPLPHAEPFGLDVLGLKGNASQECWSQDEESLGEASCWELLGGAGSGVSLPEAPAPAAWPASLGSSAWLSSQPSSPGGSSGMEEDDDLLLLPVDVFAMDAFALM